MTGPTTPERTRLVSWHDPGATAAAVAGRSGLEFMEALQRGEIPAPPIMALLGSRLVSVEEGRAVFALVPDESHYNPIGSVHGGVVSTMLDSAAGCAVQTTLPAGVGYTSLDLSVKFVRGVRVETGEVLATGTVRHRGRRTALAEATLTDTEGRLLATATSSCVVLDGRPAAGAAGS